MKEIGLFQITDYDKFPELIGLWNNWQQKTCFLSTGNCNTEEWNDLVEYGKEHKEEVAEFIYDKFESGLEVSWPEMALYDSCFGNLINAKEGQYISPQNPDVQNAYKIACGLNCGRLKTE